MTRHRHSEGVYCAANGTTDRNARVLCAHSVFHFVGFREPPRPIPLLWEGDQA